MDFVVGIQICLSNNHTVLLQPGETTSDPEQQRADGSPKSNAVKHLVDICDDLQGRYPKDFKFTGWHPHCRCHVITILKSKDEIKQDIKRLANGETVDNTSVNEVTELPKNFETWIKNNEERLKGRATLPYFITDNQRQVNGILGIEEPKKKELSLLEIAEQRHAKRTQAQIDDIKRRYWLRFEPKGLTDEQKRANIEAYLQIEKDLGIKRGKPMAFEDANQGKGNPHFAEDIGYRVNCQTCVVAYELRRRGFDVSALPKTKGSALEKLSYHTATAWNTVSGTIPTEIFIPPYKLPEILEWETKTISGRKYNVINNIYAEDAKRRSQTAILKNIPKMITEDGRYHIHWGWRRTRTGHIITFERENGAFSFYDPQTGKTIDDIKGYFKEHKITLNSLCVYRVDNLTPNTEVIGKVLTTGDAKLITDKTVIDSGIGGSIFKRHKIETVRDIQRRWNERLKKRGIEYPIFIPEMRKTKSYLSKNEYDKFNIEMNMAEVFSKEGHKIQFTDEPSGKRTQDTIIDGIKVEFKSLEGKTNVQKRSKEGLRQGADEVWFEFERIEEREDIVKEINKLSNQGKHGKYFFRGENIIYSY